jgi:hypothetical protein
MILILAVTLVGLRLIGWGAGVRSMPTFWVQMVFILMGPLFGAKQADDAGRAALSACLDARLCPSCCYDQSGIPRESDGFTVCPECGGAWPIAASEPAEP